MISSNEPDVPVGTEDSGLYTVDWAVNLAQLWRAGKLIGGDQEQVVYALLREIERLRAKPRDPNAPQPIDTAPDGVFLVSLSVCPELWWPAYRSDGGPIYSNAHGVLNAQDVVRSPRATHWLPMPPAPVSR